MQDRSLIQARKLVATVLFEYTMDNKTEGRHLSQQNLTMLAGISWEMVHASLLSLQNEGAVRIERHRVVVNRDFLQNVIGVSGNHLKQMKVETDL
jgi:DNA-binding GntR family transcriptional regulator